MATAEIIDRIEKGVRRGIVGQEDLVRGLLVGMIANGHVLIEGVPGLAKTRAVHLLARACQMSFKRIQFTPDLLPADVVGTRIYNQQAGEFEVVRGPIFANFVLADEINRAPAKVQSALLETMQEKQVTIGRETHKLPPPFLVFATQNPIEQEGTYPLPEAQLDRFLLKLVVTYPEPENEPAVVRMAIDETSLPGVKETASQEDILDLQAAARNVHIEDKVIRYCTDLVAATRDPAAAGLSLAKYVELGASPRASIALALASRATALIKGHDAVMPHHVKQVARDVLRHRVLMTYYADAEGVTSEQVIEEILTNVKVP